MNRLILLFSVVGILFFTSCEKDQNFALSLLPQSDLINTQYVDTFTVNLKTEPYSHIRTSNTGAVLFGSYYDPIFGYTKASAVFQIQQFGYPNFNDSTDYTVDSVILYISLDPKYTPYGKPYNDLPLYLYEVTDTLKYYYNYYADQKVSDFTDFSLLGQTTYSIFDGDTTLKIYINNDLGRRFIDSVDYYFYGEVGSFSDRFKGFVLTPGDQFYDAAIYKFAIEGDIMDPLNSKSYLIMYFHPDTLPDTVLSYKMPITDLMAGYCTLIEHDYSSTNVFDSNVDSVVYLQTAGTKISLEIPYINELSDVIIHKAVLDLKLEDPQYTYETSFAPPDNIYLVGFEPDDTTQTPVMLAPYYNTATGKYNGFPRVLNTYSINLTHIIQQSVTEGQIQDSLDLAVVDLFSNQKLTRAVFTTQKNSHPAKLVVFYTKIQK